MDLNHDGCHRFYRPFLQNLFVPWQDALSSWKKNSSSPNQFSMNRMTELSTILKYTCALIVGGNDYHLPWSFKWSAAPSQEWLGKSTCFLQAVIVIFYIWMASEKNSSVIALANPDSWFIAEYHVQRIIHRSLLILFSQLKLIFFSAC